jgi:hypothetical protein
MHPVIPNENPVAMPDHSEDQPFVAAAMQSEKDDRPFHGYCRIE